MNNITLSEILRLCYIQEPSDPKLPIPSYLLIDQLQQAQDAVDVIKKSHTIALDLEGENLSRRGTLSLIQIMTESKEVFLFDVISLGNEGINAVGTILEDSSITKLVWDFRNDNDCLFHNYGVQTTNLLDLQLVEYWAREELKPSDITTLHYKCAEWIQKDGRSGWDSLRLPSLKRKSYTSHEARKWTDRPIQKSNLDYAALDLAYIFHKYDAHQTFMEGNDAKNPGMVFWRTVSAEYARFYSDKYSRKYDKWEENAFIPLYVFPKFTVKVTQIRNQIL